MILVTDKYAFFYKEWPSNFFRSNFVYKGKDFFCTEQAFMWEKADFFKDDETAEKILACESPWTAKDLGREVKNYVDSEWDAIRYLVMRDVNLAKYQQNPTLAGKLVGRKYAGRTFVEASPVDNIWGVGLAQDDPRILDEKNWTGRNLLGKAITEVRDILEGTGW